ncbi:uncharacterized protein PpBr36_10028 [Pyricularia pennisetigena]|uniref:uncharacterized protein n=1 Tax=Pyricularia pennisetigena TaxID=1578925 RepID=UPI001150C880|nr:uncharacterized protein PpBr36_10028 [Pyricularia pennisetigena]TLS22363.1 hypothetical protein PpBr36_10028 [Pyricularia pennisetigena]
MPTISSAGDGRRRTRSQVQDSDKRRADEFEMAPVDTTKRLRTWGGSRRVLQPISIKEEEDKEDIRVKAEPTPPVPSRSGTFMRRCRLPCDWDDDTPQPSSPHYHSTNNRLPPSSRQQASSLTAKLRNRRDRSDTSIVAPKIESSSRTMHENEAPARGALSRRDPTETPSIAVLRQEQQNREEDIRLVRERIARQYPLSESRTDGYVAEPEPENEDGDSCGEGNVESGGNRFTPTRERSSMGDDSDDKDLSSENDDTDSDKDENQPLIHVRSRLRVATFRVISPIPKYEDDDMTESEDENKDDAASSPVQNDADDRDIESSSSIASSSAACSTCGESEASEDEDLESHASNLPTDVEPSVAIYDDEDAHARLNDVLRRAPAPSPTRDHETAAGRSIHNGMQLRSPAQIMRQRQDDVAADQQDANANAGSSTRFQSSSPPRAYDYDEYRLRARYLEQFKGLTAAQLDEAGRDLDYMARKLNSKRSAYEIALHERAFPRY